MLQERIDYFTYIFSLLQETNSRNEKLSIVDDIPESYKDDFDYIVECLAGKHIFGYTYYNTPVLLNDKVEKLTVRSALELLQIPYKTHNLSRENIQYFVELTTKWYDFFEPIVNRTLKLGIGNSLIDKTEISPMLAKKFEGYAKYDKNGYYITEKLDGNRCIAHYENGKWEFTSRNGKPMRVNFDMSGLDTNYIYDGEVLSPEQVKMSIAIENKVKHNIDDNTVYGDHFSATSGLINSMAQNKQLIYNVFDIVHNVSYDLRRRELDLQKPEGNNVRIVPILKHFKTTTELDECWDVLNSITDMGGEGLMINLGSASYLHKRTDNLLKLKKVYTMDMYVTSVKYGTGKYEGLIGALTAYAKTDDGKIITCSVGTGLSDSQREEWAADNSKIVGKTIEVSYFSLSQSAQDLVIANNMYSLRFPRLKKVRTDKTETSVY